MTHVYAFIDALGEMDGSTLTMLVLICTATLVSIRDKVASVFSLMFFFPLALFLSMSAYLALETAAMFNMKKMAEWLMAVIGAGTVGCVSVIAVMAVYSSLVDHTDGKTVHLTQ